MPESDQRSSLRHIPSVDELSRSPAMDKARNDLGPAVTLELCRQAIAFVRDSEDLLKPINDRSGALRICEAEFFRRYSSLVEKRPQNVINATGTVIHTNLGRAPLSDAAISAVLASANYSNVELSLSTGKRGGRGEYAEELLKMLTGAEAALIVNNCAAAAFLVLSVLAKGKEVIVSRGELVEIGGGFRIPDVLERSGARLREVGTTNRTKLADYGIALSPETAMVMRVHPSNFKIIGFMTAPTSSELADFANDHEIIYFEDAGSGALSDLDDLGVTDEPVIRMLIENGVHIVSFSGDKLLGGPQAGIIVGAKKYIEMLRADPMYRALRAGKLVYSALSATLESYLRGDQLTEIPVLRMLSESLESLAARTQNLKKKFEAEFPASPLQLSISESNSVVGGGAAPDTRPASVTLDISCGERSDEEIARHFREHSPPIIGRIEESRFKIDLRTVPNQMEKHISEALVALHRTLSVA